MLIRDMEPGERTYTQLSHDVLAVLSRRHDGWCIYVGAVPGLSHNLEWHEVASSGNKQCEAVAKAIAQHCWHPGLDPGDLPYAR